MGFRFQISRPDTASLLLFFPPGRYSVVVDATDNVASRYLISDACIVGGRVRVQDPDFRVQELVFKV